MLRFLKRHAYLVVIAVLIAAIWFWTRHIDHFDWNRFRDNILQADWRWLLAASLMVLTSYVGRAVRWQLMIRPMRPQASFYRLLVATAIGFSATILLGRAGEFVRPYLIARKEGVSISSQLAVWAAERIFDLLMILLLFGFALSQLDTQAAKLTPSVARILEASGWALGVLSLVCLIAIITFRFFHDGLHQRLLDALGFLPPQPLERVTRFLDSFGEGMLATRDLRSLTLLFVYSVAEWLVLILVAYCVMHALPGTNRLSMLDTMVMLGFVAFGGSVQLPGIGGGAQMATMFSLTELFNVAPEAASGAALLLWLVNFVIIIPFGAGLAFHEGLHWKDMHPPQEPPSS